jgi:hypothetical protein
VGLALAACALAAPAIAAEDADAAVREQFRAAYAAAGTGPVADD